MTNTGPVSYDEALRRVVRIARPTAAEPAPLAESLGRTLRRDVVADRDQPPFDRSTRDGFAVRSADGAAGARKVCGNIAAGAPASGVSLGPGEAVRIATGASLPDGADAVVALEQAEQVGGNVRLKLEAVEPRQHVHRRAADAGRSEVVLRRGTVLQPHHLGIAASVGAMQVQVAARPRVVVLTSGDEVRPADTATHDLLPQQIRNSNGPMVASLVEAMGAQVLYIKHVVDETDDILPVVDEALSHADCLVTTGGVSVGQRDRFAALWEMLGFRKIVHGVAIQPGKPFFAADGSQGRPVVLGLPGNPVSALVTAHLFVRPLLRRVLRGDSGDDPLPWRRVPLAEPARPGSGRQLFRAACLAADGRVSIIPWQGSGDLVHTAAADGLVRLPMQDEPIAAAGEPVLFLAF